MKLLHKSFTVLLICSTSWAQSEYLPIDTTLTNHVEGGFLLPADFRQAAAQNLDYQITTNAQVIALNPEYDTNEICRIWSVGGETKITSFLGHTNLFEAQFSFGGAVARRAMDFALTQAQIVANSLMESGTNALDGSTSGFPILTNLPALHFDTNSLIGFFGTNPVVVGMIGTTNNNYDVGISMRRTFDHYWAQIKEWSRSISVWVMRGGVGLFFLWSMYDMIFRFFQTKPGSHNFGGSIYATFSFAWAATGTFWLTILMFILPMMAIHFTYASAFWALTATDWSTLWGPAAQHILAGPTGAPTVSAPAGQFLTGITGTVTAGTLFDCVKFFFGLVGDLISLQELLTCALAVAIFTQIRQITYTSACAIAAIVGGAA